MIPSPEGICPACRNNARDRSGTDASKASLSVLESDVFPNACYRCFDATARTTSVLARRRVTADSTSLWSALFDSAFDWVRSVGSRKRKSNRSMQSVEIVLPQCAGCGKAVGQPLPQFVNLNKRSMTFIVHVDFKQTTMRINESRPADPTEIDQA